MQLLQAPAGDNPDFCDGLLLRSIPFVYRIQNGHFSLIGTFEQGPIQILLRFLEICDLFALSTLENARLTDF